MILRQLNLGILYSLKKSAGVAPYHGEDATVSGTERRLNKAMQMHSKGNGDSGLGYRTWTRPTLPSTRRTRTHTAKQFTTLFPALAPQFPDVLTLTSGDVAAAALSSAVYAFRGLTRIESAEVAIGLTRACFQRD